MRELGLAELFEATVISCDLGYMKPHPRIFQHTLQTMGIAGERRQTLDKMAKRPSSRYAQTSRGGYEFPTLVGSGNWSPGWVGITREV